MWVMWSLTHKTLNKQKKFKSSIGYSFPIRFNDNKKTCQYLSIHFWKGEKDTAELGPNTDENPTSTNLF